MCSQRKTRTPAHLPLPELTLAPDRATAMSARAGVTFSTKVHAVDEVHVVDAPPGAAARKNDSAATTESGASDSSATTEAPKAVRLSAAPVAPHDRGGGRAGARRTAGRRLVGMP